MTKISKDIFDNYQIRKTKKQKTAFIEFIKQHYPEAHVEQGGLFDSRNIVIGDVSNAKAVITAHYDTCAVLPFPNFITPQNLLFILLYGVLIAIPIIGISVLAQYIVLLLTNNSMLSFAAYFISLIALFVLIFAGKPNKHTANDNTSGVIELCELMASLSEEEKRQFAFVFFDNEENGMIGSSLFKKMHKNEMQNKLLINYDCISDGDNIMFVLNKKTAMLYGDKLSGAFEGVIDKKVFSASTATTLYPSDQMLFQKSIGVAALKKSSVFGYYLDRIHTKRDTVFDEKNIEIIQNISLKFLRSI